MERRILGKIGLEVSAIGPGCMGLTQSYPPYPDKKEVMALKDSIKISGARYPTEQEKLTGR